jgi:hypothetical protein
LKNYRQNLSLFHENLEEHERDSMTQVASLMGKSRAVRLDFSQRCVERDLDDIQEWVDLVRQKSFPEKTVFYYKIAWEKFSKEAVMSKLL